MPPSSSPGANFAQILAQAQTGPTGPMSAGRDLPDLFPAPQGVHHEVKSSVRDPRAIDGVVAYHFNCKLQVFVVYRPYERCGRCAQAIAQDGTLLPADAGDYTCPHTQLAEFQAVQDAILAGHAVLGSEAEVVQHDGTIVRSLKWYVKTPKKSAGPSPTTP